MSVEISLNTPLADALNTAIKPKLVEVGWGTGGSDDSALAEYVILMLVNGKTQDQIAAELSGELLSLPADDPGVRDFSKWLFEQIDRLSGQMDAGGQTLPDQPQGTDYAADVDTEMTSNDVSESHALNAPTGPRSMRGNNLRGGPRDKRMLGHMNKAMDRSGEGSLHRTRGNDRINTHGRSFPMGPRTGFGRPQRNNSGNNNSNKTNIRAANLEAGLGVASGHPTPGWNSYGPQPNQMELMALLEQQNQMMLQLSQQLMSGGGPAATGGVGQRPGKSLFERVSDGQRRNNWGKGGNKYHQDANANPRRDTEAGEAIDGDVEMTDQKHEAVKPEETVCKFNLNCTNKECKFAHQSPAAVPGTSIDMNDRCSFGAACKNKKCVGRHPSPATKLAHQGEQDCKFFPNCQNPRCTFRHPSMPLCRNGPGCTTPNCKFTHVKTKCRFTPCLNPHCVFAHEEGQQGSFKDKVWTAGTEEHVSQRKFVDEDAVPEAIRPGEDNEAMATASGQTSEVRV